MHKQIIKTINIFIVDDNQLFASTLKVAIENMFDNLPIHVSTFETGEKCIEKLAENIPDLVILDYQLNSLSPSALDGLQVLDKIKLNNNSTNVIMLTSNDHIDIALKSFHSGASDYVVKTENQFIKIKDSILNIFKKNELEFQKEENHKLQLAFHSEEKEKKEKELVLANVQRAEVEKHRSILEEKNKDITDSINYAKRIQQAKLPKKADIYSELSNCFVLFKPKDIVSGDFYFFQKKNKSIFIAAADCTGHGVPGAFMSMIGSGKLDDAVAYSSNTSDILRHLNIGIKNSLRQSESNESTRDGMDIAICSIDIENNTVNYAGANRPFWLIRKNELELEEIKATKKAIGGFTEDIQHFDSHELLLEKGDTFYISTDGYADQFGGEFGKKLMTKRFKEILVKIQDKSMTEQHQYLDTYVEEWKAGAEQVDDILIIGVRL